ncbi:MAG: hypothetical protein Gyms2KO_44540 [Gymnodinialimonas sp.]
MHRSGTSLVTRSLQVLGAQLGEDMARPNWANPTGYWEDTSVHALNVDALAAIGTTWDSLAPITDSDLDRLIDLGFLAAATSLLSGKLDEADIVAVKNPRMLRLKPFWDRALTEMGGAVDAVLTVRHPLSVARSLERRNAMPVRQSYLLWMTHVLAAAQMSVGRRHVVVAYDRMIQSPEQEFDRIARTLELSVDTDERAQFLSSILDPELRHTEFTDEQLREDAECPEIVQEMYSHLVGVASASRTLDQQLVEDWATEVDRLTPTLRHIDSLNLALSRARQPFSLRRSLYHTARAAIRWMPFLRALPTSLKARIARMLRC